MPGRRTSSTPEEHLVAAIRDWNTSYYIGQHGSGGPVDDEAITTLRCEIVDVDTRHKQHIGEPMDISLVCSRRYCDEKADSARPSLFYVTLRKNQRTMLSHLPPDAYWSLPTLLSRLADPCVELSFERLHRGTGALRSLWVGSYEQLVRDRAEIAELSRAK